MAIGGEPQWWSQWADSTTYGYTQPIYTSTGSAVQMQVYPAMVAVPSPPEPEDDSVLAWLRGQIAEITELATAA